MKFHRYIVILYLTFWGTTKPFPKGAVPFYTPMRNVWGLQCLSFSFYLFLIITTILVDVKLWFFSIVILICIFLMPNDVGYLFTCLLAVCNLWRTIYPDPLPGFRIGLFLFLLLSLLEFFLCSDEIGQVPGGVVMDSGCSACKSLVSWMICTSSLPFCSLFFTFLMMSFVASKFLILKSQLPTFSFCPFGAIS